MTAGRYWTLTVVFLVAVITVASTVVWLKYRPGQPVEISLAGPSVKPPPASIYIDGAVVNPGGYPLKAGDGIEALLQAAGGTTDNADRSRLELYIPLQQGEGLEAQKIDLNRAEAWLLAALPGIGQIRAQAIVEYRRQYGPFHDTSELTRVEGIGATTYEKIKNLITVSG